MTLPELTEYLTAAGEKPFRAKQLYQWMHQKLAANFDEMTNLPASLRDQLKKEDCLVTLRQVDVQISKVDGTRKYLFALPDGNVIESVLMRYQFGCSVCISSQVGCRMGCRFCASTLDGLERNLRPSEMLEQVYRIQRDCGERISHVVIMGSGEPFDNYDAVLRFLELISDPNGLNIGQRNLTVSTCGIVPKIRDFARRKPQVTLALSLHAPNDEVRRTLMPIANAYPLKDVLDACREYSELTGRRMTFEYSLVAGVNDNEQEAKELGTLLKSFPCHVNLIPVNPIKERSFTRSDRNNIEKFKNLLEKYGINVTIRREMGRDIDGACGQLRKSYLDQRAGQKKE